MTRHNKADTIKAVGLDPSLSSTGLCVITPAGEIKTELIRSLPMGGSPEDRVGRYSRLLSQLRFRLNLHNVSAGSVVVVEHYAFAAKFGKVFDRCEFGGLLRYQLINDGYRVVEIEPTVLKKYATGKGRADKAEVVSVASLVVGRPISSDDEADAINAAHVAAALVGLRVPSNKYQRDTVAKLRRQLVEF